MSIEGCSAAQDARDIEVAQWAWKYQPGHGKSRTSCCGTPHLVRGAFVALTHAAMEISVQGDHPIHMLRDFMSMGGGARTYGLKTCPVPDAGSVGTAASEGMMRGAGIARVEPFRAHSCLVRANH